MWHRVRHCAGLGEARAAGVGPDRPDGARPASLRPDLGATDLGTNPLQQPSSERHHLTPSLVHGVFALMARTRRTPDSPRNGEQRRRLGFEILDEPLNGQVTHYSREDLFLAREFKQGLAGNETALRKAARRYTAHIVEMLKGCTEPARIELHENADPARADTALRLLCIAAPGSRSSGAMPRGGADDFRIEPWAVIAAVARNDWTYDAGIDHFCTRPVLGHLPEPDVLKTPWDI